MIISFKGNTGGGGGYVLPTATDTRLGGVKVGSGLAVQEDGTLSADAPQIPIATTGSTGVVKVGSGLTADSGGTLVTKIQSYDLNELDQSGRAAMFADVYTHSADTKFIFYFNDEQDSDSGWSMTTEYRFSGNESLWLQFYSRGCTIPVNIQNNGNLINFGRSYYLTSLPVASSNTLGGVKVGSGLTIDSAGTLNQEVISFDLEGKTQAELAAIQDFVCGHTSDYRFQFTWRIPDTDRFATSKCYSIDGNDGSIYMLFETQYGAEWWGYLQSNGQMEKLDSWGYVKTSDSCDYSPFNKHLHLSSGGTLYFDDTEVNSGGTYDDILNSWGAFIFVGAYGNLKDFTGPYDIPFCPLYVDSSSTDSGRTLAFPEVIDEPTDGSIIHNEEVADHKITLVYDEYKVSYYCGGSHNWIVGLSVTPIPKAVTSDYVSNIWKGTQAQYDALSPNYDNNTLYVIV